MPRFFQVIIVVLTISLSAFLISRSCGDHGGHNDPGTRGGEAKVMPSPEAQKPSELTASASPAPRAEEEHSGVDVRAENRVKESQRPAPRTETRTVVAARPSAEATPETTASALPETSASGPGDLTGGASITLRPRPTGPHRPRAEVADERIQGTWMLTDERGTKLELRILKNGGFVTATVTQAGRPVTFEQQVMRVDSGDKTVNVYAEERDTSLHAMEPERPERMVLGFQFNADGTPQVVVLRIGSIQTPLKVLSHTK